MTEAVQRVRRNALWSLGGQVVPLVIAVFAVPVLMRQVGLERFGFFSLAWALVGYASLFDMGISRAATRLVAARLAEGRSAEARAAANTALWVMTAIGAAMGLAIFLSADALIRWWLKVPDTLHAEAVNGVRLLALSMPLVLASSAYRGALEGWQQFKALSLVRLLMGVLNFGAPLVAAYFWPRIETLVLSLFVTRALTTWLMARAYSQHCKAAPAAGAVDGGLRDMLKLGGWMSVSNLLAPLMGFVDRFVLGASVPLALVSAYTAVFDMVGRVLILPYSLMSAIFPVMAGERDREALARTYGGTARLLLATMLPVMLLLASLAYPLVHLWLGQALADSSSAVLQVLAIGVLANALAQAPANLIQGSGNPRTMAVLHLIEFPLLAAALWWATQRWGILGTAWCWTARMVIDGALLHLVVHRRLAPGALGWRWLLSVLATVPLFAAAIVLRQHAWVLPAALASTLLAMALVWFLLLNQEDRAMLASGLVRLRSRAKAA